MGEVAESRPSGSKNGRGRPRDEDLHRRVLEAGFEELAEGGISHFSVTAVARRAGVAKGSIYLRWPSREQLIVDSAKQLAISITAPEGATFREQLEHFTDQWAAAFARPRAMEVLLRVDADRDAFPELFQQIFHHMQGAGNRLLQQAVVEAQGRGEVDPALSPVLVNRLVVGPMFVEALAYTPAGHVSERFRRELIDALMAISRVSPAPVGN